MRCTATSSRPARPPVSWEQILDRLAVYEEKTLALKSKIKSALMYPTAVMVVAFVVLAVIMIFVIPAFKEVFTSFGADLPAPTLAVMVAVGPVCAVLVAVVRRDHWRRLLLPPYPGAARRKCRWRWTVCCCAHQSSAS